MKAKITLLPGDGIGPEVTAQARRVLETVAKERHHQFAFSEAPIGGYALDAVGSALPETTLQVCREADAVFLGAVGGPQWEKLPGAQRPESGLLALRRGLGTYANIRPVQVHPVLADRTPLKADIVNGTDLIVVRELTGGIYFGEKGREGGRAWDTCVYTEAEVERIVRVACGLARDRSGKVTSVDKANVLETSRLWRETAERVVAREFPDLVLEHLYVDAAAMHLLRKPGDFDVIVTSNMFGDILTDEASMLAGSMGVLPSASLAENGPGLFEPIHGSAPDIAGRGIANPYAAILSVAMLLRLGLGLHEEASSVERAVSECISLGVLSEDLCHGPGSSTVEIGEAVCSRLESMHTSVNFTACFAPFTL